MEGMDENELVRANSFWATGVRTDPPDDPRNAIRRHTENDDCDRKECVTTCCVAVACLCATFAIATIVAFFLI